MSYPVKVVTEEVLRSGCYLGRWFSQAPPEIAKTFLTAKLFRAHSTMLLSLR
jgi:hypothetical protein